MGSLVVASRELLAAVTSPAPNAGTAELAVIEGAGFTYAK